MTPPSNLETPESNSNLNPVLPENPEQNSPNSPSPLSNLDAISQDINSSIIDGLESLSESLQPDIEDEGIENFPESIEADNINLMASESITESEEEKENQLSSEAQISQPQFYLPVSQTTTDEADEIPDEVEMGFFDHLEELRQRIFYSLIAVFVGIIGCFAFVNPIVQLLQRPASGIKFVQLAPGEYFFVSLKVAGYSGLVVATPFILYQITMFVLPGLTRKERRLLVPALLGFECLIFIGFRLCLCGFDSSSIELFCQLWGGCC